MKKIQLLFIAILPLMCGCSQESSEALYLEADPTAPITLVGRVDNEALYPTTRGSGMLNGATATGLDISLFRADWPFTAAEYLATSPTAAAIEAEENINTDGTINTGLFYLANREKRTRLLGVAPRVDGTTVTWNATERKITYPAIDGATDIVASTLIEGSKNDPMGRMTFGHMLSQLKVNIQTIASLAGTWGNVTNISIAGKKQGIILTLPAANIAAGSLGTTPAVATASGTGTDLALTSPTGTEPTALAPTTTSTFYGQAMFAPELNSTALTLHITTSTGLSLVTTLPAQTYLPGTSYTATLTFTETIIIPVGVTITPWNNILSIDDENILSDLPNGWDKDIIDWTKPLTYTGEQNCYMVPAGGQLLIPISRALTAAKTPEGLDADLPVLAEGEEFFTKVLWTENAGVMALKTETQASTQVITIGKGPRGYILVKPGGTGSAAGNAGLALQKKNADGTYTTLWSWHIWVTDYVPNPKTNNGFMDRNLGATTTTPNIVTTSGMVYQWGRKDPFPGAKTAGLNELNNPNWWNGGVVTVAVYSTPSIDLATSIKTPMTFITNNWRGSAGDDSWENTDGSKTIYDPCPEGYRVPAIGSWGTEDLTSAPAIAAAGWGTWNYGYTNPGYGGYYPAAGIRSHSDGGLVFVGLQGRYWLSTYSGLTSHCMNFNERTMYLQIRDGRPYGFAVRCVANQ